VTIKKFFAISILVHLIILIAVYLMPAPVEKKPKEFQARLVTPEEMPKPLILPRQRVRPLPVPPPVMKRIMPSVPVPPRARRTPSIPPPPPSVRQKPSPPATPAVPGEGRGTGKVPTERPSPGAGGKAETGIGTGSSKLKGPRESFGRNELFDPGIIAEEARKGSGSPGKEGEKEHPVTFDTKEYRFAGYMTKLREKIESIWIYPPEAAQRGIYGDLKIQFTINKDGTLGEVRLIRTSGYKMLDDAAIRALKDGQPYWPLPDDWHMKSYTILGHFVYSLYGYELR
jgi:periplasmic protein TonB